MNHAQLGEVHERAEYAHVHNELRAQRQPPALVTAQRGVVLLVKQAVEAARPDELKRQIERLGARRGVCATPAPGEGVIRRRTVFADASVGAGKKRTGEATEATVAHRRRCPRRAQYWRAIAC